MDKIKNNNPVKILWLIVLFLVMSIAAYAQDSSRSSSSTQSPSQGISFNDDARQLADSLIQQTGLSVTKADKISQILVDYRNDISDARSKFLKKQQDANKSTDVTGGQSRVNMTGILGDNVDQYYIGATPELMSDYKDADKKADNKIRDAFDDDAQKAKYDQIKGQWWKDVKDKVFTSLTPAPPEQPMK